MDATDPGSGNERTALAWQRTSLSLLAGSAVLTRLTLDRLGVAAFMSLAVAMPLAAWVLVESRVRQAQRARPGGIARPRGGRAAAALAMATFVVGLTELAALLVGSQ